jgi:hypothetical protein
VKCRIRWILGALAALRICSSSAWSLDLRTGVPEGNIEIYLNQLVGSASDPATDFAFIGMAPFNDGTGRLAVSTIQGGVRVLDADRRVVHRLQASAQARSKGWLIIHQGVC